MHVFALGLRDGFRPACLNSEIPLCALRGELSGQVSMRAGGNQELAPSDGPVCKWLCT